MCSTIEHHKNIKDEITRLLAVKGLRLILIMFYALNIVIGDDFVNIT